MTEQELQNFLGWDPPASPYSDFDADGAWSRWREATEWIKWAEDMIQGAEISKNSPLEMSDREAIAYLCRVMVVLEEFSSNEKHCIHKDPADKAAIMESNLRPAFVEGLMYSGADPAEDGGYWFEKALSLSELRGLVVRNESGWPETGLFSFFCLSAAGRRWAFGEVTDDENSTTSAANPALQEQDNTREAATARPQKPRQRRVKGVSLQDAAERIKDDEYPDLPKHWRNLRSSKLPASIGEDPKHPQRKLYKPAALLSFLEEIYGEYADSDWGLTEHFRKVSRLPRQLP